ncbi:lysylphosphatidylglycerol synthase transmembrane domain-containing protein [Pedobacter panaciterrae]
MPDKKARFLSFPRTVFYILCITAFYFTIRYVGKFRDIGALIAQISPFWLALTFGAQVLTYAANAMILSVLLKGQTRIKFFTLFKISVVTIFVNQALPTGGLSGNGYVFNQLVKRKLTVSKAYYTLITQTVCYYLAVILMLSIFYCWYLNYTVHTDQLITYTVIIGYCYFTLLGIFIILISNKRILYLLKTKLSKFSFIRNYLKRNKILSIKNQQQGLLQRQFKDRKSILTVILLQLLVIVLDIITIYSILHGFRIALSPAKMSFALLLSQVIGALPISPGSLLAYESAMTYFLTKLGTPVHAALITTLIFRFFTFWFPIPVGMILYRNLSKPKHDFSPTHPLQ